MSDIDFSQEELLSQAAGNQSALWIAALDWALQRDGSIDQWAEFLGRLFAPGWEQLKGGSVRDVARIAGMNLASGADSQFVSLEGDDHRADAVIEGPKPEWLEGTKVSREDVDRANEIVFRQIAESLDLDLAAHRDDAGLHLVFSRR